MLNWPPIPTRLSTTIPRSTTENAAAITCASCEACCCKLQVFVMAGDDVPEHFIDYDQWDAAVMRRASDGWCAALSRDTLLCTIYQRRPAVCREYAMGGGECIDERALHGVGVPVTVLRAATKS